jgi:ribosomal-protein-serine acetyltransferase
VLGIHVDDHIELRLHEPRHAEELFRLVDANRDHLRKWLGWVDSSTSPEDTRRFIRDTLAELANGGEYGFAILQRGELVGGIGLRVSTEIREAEIGYWLAAAAQGQGTVTRATRAVIRFAFDDLGTNRVVIKCAEANAKSRAVPERLGFTLEGTLRRRDVVPGQEPRDQVLYALLRSEWTD